MLFHFAFLFKLSLSNCLSLLELVALLNFCDKVFHVITPWSGMLSMAKHNRSTQAALPVTLENLIDGYRVIHT